MRPRTSITSEYSMPSSPVIVVVGSNHEYAPVEIRERLAFSGEGLREGLDALQNHVPEGMILSTCNRTEIYAVGESPEDVERDVIEFLSRYHELETDTLRGSSYVKSEIGRASCRERVQSAVVDHVA